jgi:hypothetical protein
MNALPCPSQRHPDLRDRLHRPTVGLDGAKHLLDLNEDYIIDLIADRALSHAWNIGLGDERREIRLLRASIDHYIAHGSALVTMASFRKFLQTRRLPC